MGRRRGWLPGFPGSLSLEREPGSMGSCGLQLCDASSRRFEGYRETKKTTWSVDSLERTVAIERYRLIPLAPMDYGRWRQPVEARRDLVLLRHEIGAKKLSTLGLRSYGFR